MIGDSALAERRSTRALGALVCVMFFLFAMTTDAVGSVIATVVVTMHLSLTAAGAFHYAPMLAIAVGGLCLGFLADRLGRQWAIFVGLALYGVGSVLFAVGEGFAWYVGLLALSGLGISVFKVGGLALVGDVVRTDLGHRRLMNAIEGCFAVGSIVGPALVATLLRMQVSWRWLYVIAAAICFILIVFVSRMQFPARRRVVASKAPLTDTLNVLKAPRIIPLICLMMLYVGVEVAVYVWMPTYLEQYQGGHRWLALYALTLFFVLRACGRFLGAWLLGRFRVRAVLALAGAAVFCCFAGATVGGAAFAAWLLPLSGLAMSVIYPTLNSQGISGFPREQQGSAAGVLLFFTALAAALGPLAMAALSDATGDVRSGFVLATVFALLLSVGLVVAWRRETPQSRRAGAPGARRRHRRRA